MRTLLLALVPLSGCRTPEVPEATGQGALASKLGHVELVETAPVETVLDHADLREAATVWVEMIESARHTIDLEHFYASNRAGGRLEPVIAALERAAARGVRIRVVADAGFHQTYPATLDRLDATRGIELRLLDLRARTGGVQHAKAMVVDGRQVFCGSQNLDWRSLEHIQELGLKVVSEPVARAFEDVFELDWRLAAGEPAPQVEPRVRARDFPVVAATPDGGRVLVTPAFSPRGLLPDPELWDLPALVDWIDAAQERVRVQLLSYKAIGRDGEYWNVLEGALRRAAARGVRVELLLSHWSQRHGTIEGLQSLQCLSNVEVRLVTIPEAAEGFLPYARVIHAKYMVVDGRRAWVGTANWEKSYFTTSRNMGLLVDGQALAARLDAFFQDGWDSPYAETVDPARAYEAPRIGE